MATQLSLQVGAGAGSSQLSKPLGMTEKGSAGQRQDLFLPLKSLSDDHVEDVLPHRVWGRGKVGKPLGDSSNQRRGMRF